MSENNGSSGGSYLTAAVVGALIGAGVALLYAPYSGKETRKLLARRAKKLKGQAESALEDAKELIREKKADLEEAIENGKEAMRGGRAKHSK